MAEQKQKQNKNVQLIEAGKQLSWFQPKHISKMAKMVNLIPWLIQSLILLSLKLLVSTFLRNCGLE